MNRFAFTSIALATFALAACGDDSTGTGGGGGATASSSGDTTSTASSSPTSSSSSSKAATSSSGSEGTGGDPTGTGGSPDTGSGGETGSGGDTGTGGTGAGTGGSSGACAVECATNPEDLNGLSEGCQTCAEDEVGGGACQTEFLACLGAEAGPDDTEGCTTCSEIANTGSLEGLCESNLDEATAALACICGVCG